MRRLFIALVPGTPLVTGIWCFTTVANLAFDSYLAAGVHMVIAVLNLYSLDMQRRRA